MPPVEISAVGAEGRDLELQSVFQHDDDAEMRADRIGAGENFLHLLRARIGRDVDVLRRLAADQIAHAAAGEIGDVAGRAQSIDERARGRSIGVYLIEGFTATLDVRIASALVRGSSLLSDRSMRPADRRISTGASSDRSRLAGIAEGMNDEADDRDADAGIGDVKGRPGMRRRARAD